MLKRSSAFALASAFVLSACDSIPNTPAVPPTPLSSIQVEANMERVWTRKISSSAEGQFQPLVLDGVVYAASRKGQVAAIEQSTGERKWTKQLDVSLGSGIGGADNQLYVSSNDGLVLALNAEDGDVIWERQASSEVLAAVSAGFGAVIVRSADGRIVSLDPSNGEELWSTTYTTPPLTINGYSQPLLVEGGALVGLEDGRLLALGTADGDVLWESVVSVASGRSEVERLADLDGRIRIDDSAIYAANYQGRLARIEPARGQIQWSVPMSSTVGVGLSENAVFVVSEDDEVHAYDKANGQLIWTQKELKNRHLGAPQVINDNLVVMGDLEGFLHILSSEDGRIIGRSRISRRPIFPHISANDDTIFVQSTDGTVAALRPRP